MSAVPGSPAFDTPLAHEPGARSPGDAIGAGERGSCLNGAMPASPVSADLRIDGVLSLIGGTVVLVVGLVSGATHAWVLVAAAAVTVVFGLFGARRRRLPPT